MQTLTAEGDCLITARSCRDLYYPTIGWLLGFSRTGAKTPQLGEARTCAVGLPRLRSSTSFVRGFTVLFSLLLTPQAATGSSRAGYDTGVSYLDHADVGDRPDLHPDDRNWPPRQVVAASIQQACAAR